MNPNQGISPPMSNNEGIRRILNIFMDLNGLPRPGSPSGPAPGLRIGNVYRHIAMGPSPVTAYQLAPLDNNRIGGLLRNLDATDTIWYGTDPNITDVTGATLLPGENVPISIRGAIYVYCVAGSPIAELAPVFAS